MASTFKSIFLLAVVFEGLHKLFLGVHHKWTVIGDWLVERLTCYQNELRCGGCCEFVDEFFLFALVQLAAVLRFNEILSLVGDLPL